MPGIQQTLSPHLHRSAQSSQLSVDGTLPSEHPVTFCWQPLPQQLGQLQWTSGPRNRQCRAVESMEGSGLLGVCSAPPPCGCLSSYSVGNKLTAQALFPTTGSKEGFKVFRWWTDLITFVFSKDGSAG